MKMSTFCPTLCLAIAAIAATAPAQQPTAIKPNQTQGFGAGKLLTFTYTQSFDCIDQPLDDLNFDKIKAENEPAEFQVPICQAGNDPTINPPGQTGKASKTTDPIYVLVPMFSVDNDQNPNDAISCTNVVPGTICGATLGNTLIQLFGAVPEAFKTTPLVSTQ